jgi:hypothetical protein
MPVSGLRQAEPLATADGRVGVFEPTWSEANGVTYTLELEKTVLQCHVVIDAHNEAAK